MSIFQKHNLNKKQYYLSVNNINENVYENHEIWYKGHSLYIQYSNLNTVEIRIQKLVLQETNPNSNKQFHFQIKHAYFMTSQLF